MPKGYPNHGSNSFGQASLIGRTVGITAVDLVGDQCSTVLGLHPRNEGWLSGDRPNGVWFGSQ